MTDSTEVFNAAIVAKDQASKTIDGIIRKVHGLGAATEHEGGRASRAFEGLTGSVNLLHSRMGNVRASVGEFGSSITELVPALAAFGAIGSAAGLVELAGHAAEAAANLGHMSAVLGMSTQTLQRLDYVATMTDTSVDGMHSSMNKLNKAIGEGSKNKDVASLFSHLAISTKDANGHLLTSEQLLPKLADAFKNTHSAAMRTRMAMALFGKSGADMLPLLMKGGASISDTMKESGTVGHVNTKGEQAGLEAYADSMKKMRASITGFSDELGAKLAPVLTPIINDITAWMSANKDWLTTEISGKVKELGDWLRKVDWHATITGLTDAFHHASDLADKFGGLKTAAGALGVVMGAELAVKIGEAAKAMQAMSLFFLTNPFGIVIAGAALLGLAVYELWTHWAWVKKQFGALFDWFTHQSAWTQTFLTILFPFVGLPMVIMEHWGPIKQFFTDLWADIKVIFDQAMGWMDPVLDKLGGAAKWVGRELRDNSGLVGGPFGSQSQPTIFSPLDTGNGGVSPQSLSINGAPGGAGAGGKVQVDVNIRGGGPGTQVRANATGSVAPTVRRAEGMPWPGSVPAF